jgi:hypothetical protein
VLRGAALWPFNGDLAELARGAGIVIAETYPAEAYRMVGAGFGPGQSKRRQADRRGKAGSILSWAGRNGVAVSASAVAGVEGRRPEQTERDDATAAWEGWILGQRSPFS